MNKRIVFMTLALLTLLTFVSGGRAADGKKMTGVTPKIILTPDELQWKEGPPALPEAKIAVLEGDPNKRGFFVMRIKLPAGTRIPPHLHKNRERVTVLSGKFNLAMGDKPENPRTLPAGSYFSLSAHTVHNAWVDEETVLQISTLGPWILKPAKKETEQK